MRCLAAASMLTTLLGVAACGSHAETDAAGTTTSTSAATSGSTSGSTSGGATTSGSATSGTSGTSGGTTGFTIASHQPLPIIPNLGGPTLNPIDVVTISYADVQIDLQDYIEALLATDWLPTVGTEYGITSGQHLADYAIPGNGPGAVSDTDVQAMLVGLIDAGLVPSPTSSTIYAIEYPVETTITYGQVGTSCQEFGGYHGFEPTTAAVYAVLANCSADSDQQSGFGSVAAADQFYMSHEIFEAASDPATPQYSPGYTLPQTTLAALPWILTYNSELADLCVTTTPVVLDAGLIATRIWSNAAADAGLPGVCAPSPAGEIYFTVSPAISGQDAGAPEVGIATANDSQPQTLTFVLTGWSTAPMNAWFVGARLVTGTFTPDISLSNSFQGVSTINNGQTETLTVTIPAFTPSESFAGITLYSGTNEGATLNEAAVAIAIF